MNSAHRMPMLKARNVTVEGFLAELPGPTTIPSVRPAAVVRDDRGRGKVTARLAMASPLAAVRPQ
jgi:hypothetical protein